MTLRLTVKHFWIIPFSILSFSRDFTTHLPNIPYLRSILFFINAQLYISVSIYVFALILPIRIFSLLTILYMFFTPSSLTMLWWETFKIRMQLGSIRDQILAGLDSHTIVSNNAITEESFIFSWG